MDPALFLSDLERRPHGLAHLADRVLTDWPSGDMWDGVEEVLFVGMGSSAYASGVAAARLRELGIRATAELASSDLLPPPHLHMLVVAVSASGSSPETVRVAEHYGQRARILAVTQDRDSPLGRLAGTFVPLLNEPERGGVACLTYQHTLAALLGLEAAYIGNQDELVDLLYQAMEATADLIVRRDSWLPAVADALDGPHGVYVAAPFSRLCSAQQSALMVREGPRRPGVACETADWNHVDVYLTKTLDYRLLLLPGAGGAEEELLRWTSERGSTVVAVGEDIEQATLCMRYLHDDVEDVRLLTEVLVAELVAQRWWAS